MAKHDRDSDEDYSPASDSSASDNDSDNDNSGQRGNNGKVKMAKELKYPSKATILVLAHIETEVTEQNGAHMIDVDIFGFVSE